MKLDDVAKTEKDHLPESSRRVGGRCGSDLFPCPSTRDTQQRVAAAITVAGVGLAMALALLSNRGYHDDGLTHYLYARWAWNDPGHLLDEWGRPGLTCLLFPFARLGWTACRIEMAMLSGAAVWFAFLTARRLGMKHAALIAPLSFGQPLFVMLSYDTMTETATAFYLSLAVWLFLTGRPTVSAVVVSLCFVTRYEMLSLAPVWLVALWSVRAPWYAYAGVAWAPLAQSVIAAAVFARWPAEVIFDAYSLSEYGSGTVLTMYINSLAAAGLTVGLLAVIGCLLPWRQPRAWVVPIVYLVHLVVQTVIFWRGAYASGGYARFFVSTAPIAAIAALNAINHFAAQAPGARRRALATLAAVTVVAWIGLEIEPAPRDEAWILVLDKIRPLARLTTVLVVAAGLVGAVTKVTRDSLWDRGLLGLLTLLALAGAIVPLACLVRPHRLTRDQLDIAEAVTWLRDNDLTGAPLITTDIWTSRFLRSERNLTALPGGKPWESAQPGTVLLWDANYSRGERFGITLDRLSSNPAWRLLWTSSSREDGTVFARIYGYQADR